MSFLIGTFSIDSLSQSPYVSQLLQDEFSIFLSRTHSWRKAHPICNDRDSHTMSISLEAKHGSKESISCFDVSFSAVDSSKARVHRKLYHIRGPLTKPWLGIVRHHRPRRMKWSMAAYVSFIVDVPNAVVKNRIIRWVRFSVVVCSSTETENRSSSCKVQNVTHGDLFEVFVGSTLMLKQKSGNWRHYRVIFKCCIHVRDIQAKMRTSDILYKETFCMLLSRPQSERFVSPLFPAAAK